MENTIFIQIASYRDQELVPTIKDCINNSDYPNNLVFGIAWQHSLEDEWDNLDEFEDDERFRIIDIKHNETYGTCWARSQIQKKYSGEKYSLQLDSHHRFVKGWDTILINMYDSLLTKSAKPLISTYLPPYTINEKIKDINNYPTYINSYHTNGGIPVFEPLYMERSTLEPVPGYCYSGHFAFTQGAFTQEVPHDPGLYFIGEEYSISVRAYTWGYDIYYPNAVIAYHEYTRSYRTKHWEDNKKWYYLDHESRRRIKNMFNVDKTIINYDPPYGFGPLRTIQEFEKNSKIIPEF